MKKMITMGMLQNFNSFLSSQHSILHLIPSETMDKTIMITLKKDRFINMQDQIINPTKEFFDTLENYFKNEGIELEYNNVRSCFWMK